MCSKDTALPKPDATTMVIPTATPADTSRKHRTARALPSGLGWAWVDSGVPAGTQGEKADPQPEDHRQPGAQQQAHRKHLPGALKSKRHVAHETFSIRAFHAGAPSHSSLTLSARIGW